MARFAQLVATALLSSCATIFRSRADVEITSTPAGATVSYGDASGVTPCILRVDRTWDPLPFRATLNGAVVSAEIAKTESMFGGDNPKWILPLIIESVLVLPALVDLATGSFFDTPSHVDVQFSGTSGTLQVDRSRPSQIETQRRSARPR